MIQKNDLYDYGMYIYQNSDYFKFSLDSILLAEYVELKDNIHILDVCSGNIPIPLILYNKNKTIKVDAVEIQKEIFDLAKMTLNENNLQDKINIINCDVRNFEADYKYDVITCNPPYFKYNDSKVINSSDVKSIARHEISFKILDLVQIIKKNLKDSGTFYMVHRAERLIEILEVLKKANLGIRNITFIKNQNENVDIVLIKGCSGMKNDPKIIVKDIDGFNSYKNIFN